MTDDPPVAPPPGDPGTAGGDGSKMGDEGPGPAAPAAEELPADASAHLLTTSVSRLNRLRAGVLGCNDGITSTAGLVVGVAAGTTSTTALALAGLSGLVAGSLSMGGGEFTSVQAQRDSQEELLRKQRAELENIPREELDELAHLYVERGLSVRLAREVAAELTARDALAAHAEAELGIDPRTWSTPGRPRRPPLCHTWSAGWCLWLPSCCPPSAFGSRSVLLRCCSAWPSPVTLRPASARRPPGGRRCAT